jgi:hypothetical protein
MSHHIAVSVRVRPPGEGATAVTVGPAGLAVQGSSKKFSSFAAVVQGSDQSAAYEAIAVPLLAQLRRGFSCTLCAYGQTGSGKTHTVFGPPGCLTQESVKQADGRVPVSWGLFPRIACELLLAADSGCTLSASAVEVYQDKAYDLLSNRAPLTVGTKSAGRQVGGGGAIVIGKLSDGGHHGSHPAGCRCGKCYAAKKEELAARMAKRDRAQAARRSSGVSSGGYGVCEAGAAGEAGAVGEASAAGAADAAGETSFSTVGAACWPVRSVADVAQLALTVEVTRTAVGHALNARSSRSHCLVTLTRTQRANGELKATTLVFVDLAGSERILRTSVQGSALSQALAINASLSALGKVVKALGEHAAHVPYRDSTLTMLLRTSLGGGASTAFVINVAAEAEHADESVCSLSFGERLCVVRNAPRAVVGTNAASEAERVRAALREARSELVRLHSAGYGGKYGGQPSEVSSFKENVARYAREDRAAQQMRTVVSELRTAAADAAQTAAAEARAQAHAAEASNYRDIVLRQQSIAGLFTPPKPAYMAKVALVKQLEAQLAQLGVDGDPDRCEASDVASDAKLAEAVAGALAAYRRGDTRGT